jgi:amino-acid N-acetyltransferase
MAPQLRAGTEDAAASICALLQSAGLPTEDLTTSNPQFVIAYDTGRIVAVGALQAFGVSALLRSVAVAHHLRGTGLGRIVVRDLERIAGLDGVEQLFLLTQTAQRFFEHQGYRVIDRQSVPQNVQGSAEFRTLCPASAVCMAKELMQRGPSGPS